VNQICRFIEIMDPARQRPNRVAFFGQDSRKCRTVLLMGETGIGKSTFVNYVANYFLGGNLDSLKVAIPNRLYRTSNVAGVERHSETNLDDVTVSQTRHCTTYSFHKHQAEFRCIDTPGLSCTSNSATNHADDESISAILTAANQAGELHAIILIINGTAARLTVNVQNALQRISGNCPDVLLNNIIVVFTNCNSSSKNFDEAFLPFPPQKTFVMNNSAFCSHPSTWNEDNRDLQELNWKQSMRKVGEIVEFVDQLAPQSTLVFQEILNIRNVIKHLVLWASEEIPKKQTIEEVFTALERQMSTIEFDLTREESKVSIQDKEVQRLQLQEQDRAALRRAAESDHSSVQDKLNAAAVKARNADSQRLRDQNQLDAARVSLQNTSICTEVKLMGGVEVFNFFGFKSLLRLFPNLSENGLLYLRAAISIFMFLKNFLCAKEEHKLDSLRQAAEVKEFERSIENLSHQEQTARNELRTFETQLQDLSENTSNHRAKELEIKQKKDEVVKNRKQAKALADEIRKRKADIQTQLQGKEAEMQEAKRHLEDAKNTLKEECVGLKRICSRFNFIEELNACKEFLRTRQSSLTTTKARETMDAFIKFMDDLANEFMG